jgi:hypothetical protein
MQQHNITTNPVFVDPAAGNFRLKADSPARSVGEGGVGMGAMLDHAPDKHQRLSPLPSPQPPSTRPHPVPDRNHKPDKTSHN